MGWYSAAEGVSRRFGGELYGDDGGVDDAVYKRRGIERQLPWAAYKPLIESCERMSWASFHQWKNYRPEMPSRNQSMTAS